MSVFSPRRRRILSLFLPRLPIDRITRLQAGQPGEGRILPRIVVAKENNARLIVMPDEAAARMGLHIGQPLANARAICPQLTVYDADYAADARTLEHIADWCDRFTPLVGLDQPSGLFLDITGCAHLFGGEAALLDILCQALRSHGFAAHAAIASTSICARALSHHAPGSIVADGGEAEALDALPVSALGADDAIVAGLWRAGLRTIGEVATRAPHEITARFGARFATQLAYGCGRGDTPISPRRPPPDYIVEKRFAEPIAIDSMIAVTLSRLGETLVGAMARQGKGARRLEAAFFRSDGVVRQITVETGRPVGAHAVIDRLFRERLNGLADPLDPGFGFDMIRLSASRTEIMAEEQRDLGGRRHDNDAFSALVDRITARIGENRVVVYLPQDTHIPEEAALAVPARHHLTAATQAQWPERSASEPPLRPLRLFDRPEPIRVPPAAGSDRDVRQFALSQFIWRRTEHVVVQVEGPERIAMEWWKQDGRMLTRDYFRVEDSDGLRFWIYRDGLQGRELVDDEGRPVAANWYVHGLFA